MEERDSYDAFLPPIHTNILSIPNKIDIMAAYNVYKPSLETRSLKSEVGRKIFAEAFIENPKLGPISDLSVRALAVGFPTEEIAPLVSCDPLKMRIHYDALDIDLPLKDCINIDDHLYWRRVVLEKHTKKELGLKKHDFPWKKLGITLKFIELVETCPAEYWPEEDMKNLALKIREYITEMHIRKIQSLKEHSFEQYFESDSLRSYSSEDSSQFVTPHVSIVEIAQEYDEEGEAIPLPQKTPDEIEDEEIEAAERAEKLQELREAKRAKRAKKNERQRRVELRTPTPPPPEPVEVKKTIEDIFDIEISENSDDGEAAIVDRRNPQKVLNKLKKYKYPPEDCHHIDLSFVGDFIYLTSFTIQFQGTPSKSDHHTRHFNFSYVDTQHLADGLIKLPELKIFRLINSRMDAKKVKILMKAMLLIQTLEVLDFSDDQLKDDCGQPIYEYLRKATSLKRLELTGNSLGREVLLKLASGIEKYHGELEYLGLGRNKLEDEGLHALALALVKTNQVQILNFRGAYISQKGLFCCIANELIKQHKRLLELDLVAVTIGKTAAVELVCALQTNFHILKLNCQCGDLDFDIEVDVEILLRRNKFILENPYRGNETKTTEEMNEYVKALNIDPLLLRSLAEVKRRAYCKLKRPKEFMSSMSIKSIEKIELMPKEESDIWELEGLVADKKRHTDLVAKKPSIKPHYSVAKKEEGSFNFQPNTFDFDLISKHLFIPGPKERFFNFQSKNLKATDNESIKFRH